MSMKGTGREAPRLIGQKREEVYGSSRSGAEWAYWWLRRTGLGVAKKGAPNQIYGGRVGLVRGPIPELMRAGISGRW